MDSGELGRVLGPRFEAVAGDAALAFDGLGLPAGAAVLDVGTGSGHSAIYLASRGYTVTTGEPATDASQYAGRDWAQLATKAGVRDRVRFEHFDAGYMPFESGAFDAVVFFGVLHHIPAEARGDALREALRVSKEDGVVVFFEPRAEMLAIVRADDPHHPPAANPSDYLAEPGIRERRIAGSLMDIFIYDRRPAHVPA